MVVLLSTAAKAEVSWPVYDISSICQAEALPVGGYATAIYNRCIDREQTAYDKLKAQAESVSQKEIEFCNQRPPEEIADYSRLLFCITLLRENSQPRKSFRY